jgi:hypothetical protein
MRVLGCKVSDETYEQFKSLGRPISDSLRDAITIYLAEYDTDRNTQVNHTETCVNHQTNRSRYITSQKQKINPKGG